MTDIKRLASIEETWFVPFSERFVSDDDIDWMVKRLQDEHSSPEKREQVKWFANEMENRLKDKDLEKGLVGWHDCHLLDLFDWLDEKLDALADELDGVSEDRIITLSADIANYAMMIADKARKERREEQ